MFIEYTIEYPAHLTTFRAFPNQEATTGYPIGNTPVKVQLQPPQIWCNPSEQNWGCSRLLNPLLCLTFCCLLVFRFSPANKSENGPG